MYTHTHTHKSKQPKCYNFTGKYLYNIINDHLGTKLMIAATVISENE